MSNKLNIEQLINSKLGEAEVTPSPGTWKAIHRKLRWRKFMRFNPGKPNIYYLGGLLIVSAGLITVISTKSLEKESMERSTGPEYNQLQVATNQAESPESETLRNESGNENLNNFQEESLSQKPTKDANQDISENTLGNQMNTSEETGGVSDDNRSSDNELMESAQHTMVTYFTCSVQSGCAPLTVHFRNQSMHAKSFHWTFGNGETYLDKDPLHVFEKPGNYRVTLTSINTDGQASTHHQMIEVHPPPLADFEIDEGLEDINGVKELNFINYTTGAHAYSWYLLNEDNSTRRGWSSNELQPNMKLSELELDARYIRLVASNEYGCSDTSHQEISLITGSLTPALRFPNAFSPNTTGPVGGSYSPNEKRTDLFFPVFKEVPLEYKLRIYTRRGELVFETDNIYVGWDGYYLQERSALGVYVWMAEGSWDNGSEFKLQGDVTLIWNDYR